MLRLQVKRFGRAARAAGLVPWVAAPLLVLACVAAVALLVYRLGDWAPGAVVGLTAGAGYTLAARPPWREMALGRAVAARWRHGELGGLTVLATALLLYLGAAHYVPLLWLLNGMWAWRPPRGVRLGTALGRFAPFGKTPHAFVTGLRRTWWVYVGLLLVLAQALHVQNANLATAVALAWAVVPMSFYNEPLPEQLLRMEIRGAGAYLLDQCRTALRQHGVLAVPLLLTIGFCFPAQAPWLLLGYVASAVLLVAAIGLHYRVYPERAGVAEALLFAGAIVTVVGLPIYMVWTLRTARTRLKRFLL